tara:strand:- start:1777 stop:2529 length:753 start_codon:yes stop_codon:yes gene_type:complete
MNLIKILINNLKYFQKISISLFLISIFSFFLIFVYFKNNLITINNFDIIVKGNFSYVVFNRMSKPIYQNYKSKKVYLKKNKYVSLDTRIYSVFYLDNKINDEFIETWKSDLKKSFQNEINSIFLKNFNYSVIQLETAGNKDLIDAKKKLIKKIREKGLLIDKLKNDLALDSKNKFKETKLNDLNKDYNYLMKQLNEIKSYQNKKIFFEEKNNSNQKKENKIYFSIFLIVMVLMSYFFANLYLFTLSKKSK